MSKMFKNLAFLVILAFTVVAAASTADAEDNKVDTKESKIAVVLKDLEPSASSGWGWGWGWPVIHKPVVHHGWGWGGHSYVHQVNHGWGGWKHDDHHHEIHHGWGWPSHGWGWPHH